MRIFNKDKDETLKNVLLYLTYDEALELRDSINHILKNKQPNGHEHVNDNDYTHELTVTVYDGENMRGLDQRSIKIIEEDT